MPVPLQAETVESEQEDKWLSPGRQTVCLDRQWRKKPLQGTSVEALPISLSSVYLHSSIHPPTHLSIHPLLSKVGQKKDPAWQLIRHSDEAAC